MKVILNETVNDVKSYITGGGFGRYLKVRHCNVEYIMEMKDLEEILNHVYLESYHIPYGRFGRLKLRPVREQE